jgi:hypothetical protein
MSLFILVSLILVAIWSIWGFISFRDWVKFTHESNIEKYTQGELLRRIVFAGPIAWFAAIVALLASIG